MIIDRIRLTGDYAYLRGNNGANNLATVPSSTGTTDAIPEGKVIDVTALHLHIEGEDLYKLFPKTTNSAIISISVEKEMFPDLFADPYTHRVHQVGGFEDFDRGARNRLKTMDVDGVATLVAIGTGNTRWISPIYRLADPATLTKAAWGLALSRLTHEDLFEYNILLETWQQGQAPESSNSQFVTLAQADTKPGIERFNDALAFDGTNRKVTNVSAYRMHFGAEVFHDSQLEEFHVGAKTSSLGSPLLQSIYLLEEVRSSLEFCSLNELISESIEYHLYDSQNPKRLTINLALGATLNEGEQIAIRIGGGLFKRFEARLDAEVRLRPPRIDKEIV